jgi:hypothetical protein
LSHRHEHKLAAFLRQGLGDSGEPGEPVELRRRAGLSEFFGRWYEWAIRSHLEPVKKVAAMIPRGLENVITYCKHFITNAGLRA